MTKGRHCAPTAMDTLVSTSGAFAKKAAIPTGSAMAVLLAPVIAPATAEAADGGILDAIAFCESTDNPRVVNSTGHGGLFQFDGPTWRSVGGSGRPEAASISEQYYRASLLLKARGTQPWNASRSCWGKKYAPVKAGTVAGLPAPQVKVTSQAKKPIPKTTTPATTTPATKPTAKHEAKPKPRVVVPEKVIDVKAATPANYVVKKNDTLSEIGERFDINWHVLFERNRSLIADPDLIYPGQRLTVH